MKKKGRIGSSFDEFLKQEGIYEEVTARAIKRVIARQLDALMQDQGLTKSSLARRMKTSRSCSSCPTAPGVRSRPGATTNSRRSSANSSRASSSRPDRMGFSRACRGWAGPVRWRSASSWRPCGPGGGPCRGPIPGTAPVRAPLGRPGCRTRRAAWSEGACLDAAPWPSTWADRLSFGGSRTRRSSPSGTRAGRGTCWKPVPGISSTSRPW